MFAVMHHLMGTAEIALRLGVTRQRVQQIVSRADFPKPDHELIMGKVWRTEDVEAWISAHRPEDAGRPEGTERRDSGVRRGRARWYPDES